MTEDLKSQIVRATAIKHKDLVKYKLSAIKPAMNITNGQLKIIWHNRKNPILMYGAKPKPHKHIDKNLKAPNNPQNC